MQGNREYPNNANTYKVIIKTAPTPPTLGITKKREPNVFSRNSKDFINLFIKNKILKYTFFKSTHFNKLLKIHCFLIIPINKILS